MTYTWLAITLIPPPLGWTGWLTGLNPDTGKRWYTLGTYLSDPTTPNLPGIFFDEAGDETYPASHYLVEVHPLFDPPAGQ